MKVHSLKKYPRDNVKVWNIEVSFPEREKKKYKVDYPKKKNLIIIKFLELYLRNWIAQF